MIFTCQDILDFCISARNKRDANFSNFKKVLLEEIKKKTHGEHSRSIEILRSITSQIFLILRDCFERLDI